MTDWPPLDPADPSAVADGRDELVAAVRDHANEVAYRLARLQGSDYGRLTLETSTAEWTLKHEGGEVSYLRYDEPRGPEVYVVSTQRDPEPEPLAVALADYDAFVAAFDDYVASLDGVLDDVDVNVPEPASVSDVVEARERLLGRVREVSNRIAAELNRVSADDYGTFTARVDGTRWELKWEGDRVSYLRVGGAEGVYLLSQYEAPAAVDVRTHAPQFANFVAAYNDHVERLAADVEAISL